MRLALVVGGAASVDATVRDARLERRADPQLERVDRLDVVVRVDDDGRCARRMEPVRVHDRVAGRLGDLGMLETGIGQA